MIKTQPKKAPPKKRGRRIENVSPKLGGLSSEAREELSREGGRLGRPPTGNAKRLLTLRLDVEVIEKFRATGPGWQVRMAEALSCATVEIPARNDGSED